MRAGAEYFAEPGEPAQRRYEALRAYFVEELSAAQVAARFGYSPAVVHQMASDLRAGRAVFFRDSRPGPRRPRKAGRVRDEVLALRAQDRSIEEIMSTHYGRMVVLDDRVLLFANPEDAAQYIDFDLDPVR